MLRFLQESEKRTGVSRREVLRVGALAPLGFSLAHLLASERAQAGSGSTGKASARSVVLIYLGGGLSHHDSFDLKPEASAEIRGKYNPIATCVPGLKIGELLPRMATVMNKVALVRSGSHNNDHHETATNWVLSGRFGSAFGDWPAIGSVVAHESGPAGKVPAYVAIPRNPSFTWELGKSAFLGGRFESFKAGDPNAGNYRVRDLTPNTALSSASSQQRQSLLKSLDSMAERIEGNDQLTTYGEFQQRAAEMILSRQSQSAFDVEKEPTKLRDRYGRNTFGQSCLLARRLVESGVRFVTVNYGGWDHHAQIWKGLDNKLHELDQGLSAFLTDMDVRGLMEETLIAVFGEFGRTPKINKDTGRDHWGPAASLLFAGAGVQGGKVIGATDKEGAYVTRRPVSPADVAWTIYHTLGIDPTRHLHTPDGRPVEILDRGDTVHELFS
jgi:hypothetical protein